MYNNKFMPTVPNAERFKGNIMHTSEFHDASIANGQQVVVIGGGKSAVRAACNTYHV
jgi:cation diffusion facilitator CzcD-associated flavoprotein CzcO